MENHTTKDANERNTQAGTHLQPASNGMNYKKIIKNKLFLAFTSVFVVSIILGMTIGAPQGRANFIGDFFRNYIPALINNP